MNVRTDGYDTKEPGIRVLVVDDHLLVGEMIVRSLSLLRGFDAAAVADLDAALAAIESSGRFDVVLLDYDLPGHEGLSVLDKLNTVNAGGVALFSGVAKRSVIDRALQLGAAGFIPKTTHLKTLQHALNLIASGEPYVPLDYMRGGDLVSRTTLDLKPVEVAVAVRLCAGLTNKEIARELDVTEVTVKMHVRSLFGKLGVKNRTQAVLQYQKLGLLD